MLDPKVQKYVSASEKVWYDYKLDAGAFYAWLQSLSPVLQGEIYLTRVCTSMMGSFVIEH